MVDHRGVANEGFRRPSPLLSRPAYALLVYLDRGNRTRAARSPAYPYTWGDKRPISAVFDGLKTCDARGAGVLPAGASEKAQRTARSDVVAVTASADGGFAGRSVLIA